MSFKQKEIKENRKKKEEEERDADTEKYPHMRPNNMNII